MWNLWLQKKVWQRIFFTPFFCCCFWIQDPGSEINILDPQHWSLVTKTDWGWHETFFPRSITTLRFLMNPSNKDKCGQVFAHQGTLGNPVCEWPLVKQSKCGQNRHWPHPGAFYRDWLTRWIAALLTCMDRSRLKLGLRKSSFGEKYFIFLAVNAQPTLLGYVRRAFGQISWLFCSGQQVLASHWLEEYANFYYSTIYHWPILCYLEMVRHKQQTNIIFCH